MEHGRRLFDFYEPDRRIERFSRVVYFDPVLDESEAAAFYVCAALRHTDAAVGLLCEAVARGAPAVWDAAVTLALGTRGSASACASFGWVARRWVDALAEALPRHERGLRAETPSQWTQAVNGATLEHWVAFAGWEPPPLHWNPKSRNPVLPLRWAYYTVCTLGLTARWLATGEFNEQAWSTLLRTMTPKDTQTQRTMVAYLAATGVYPKLRYRKFRPFLELCESVLPKPALEPRLTPYALGYTPTPATEHWCRYFGLA